MEFLPPPTEVAHVHFRTCLQDDVCASRLSDTTGAPYRRQKNADPEQTVGGLQSQQRRAGRPHVDRLCRLGQASTTGSGPPRSAGSRPRTRAAIHVSEITCGWSSAEPPARLGAPPRRATASAQSVPRLMRFLLLVSFSARSRILRWPCWLSAPAVGAAITSTPTRSSASRNRSPCRSHCRRKRLGHPYRSC
jgi:hypothetical protein